MHYVIGDIHGCFDEMIELLRKTEELDKDAVFYFVGDFVDRGPKQKEVLDWVTVHITPDGKYRAVLGNHEALLLQWFSMSFIPWYHLVSATGDPGTVTGPKAPFGFEQVMLKEYGNDPERIRPALAVIQTLPYSEAVAVMTNTGKEVTFRIVHAWYNRACETDPELMEEVCLWYRFSAKTVLGGDETIVHGHTPTHTRRYHNSTREDGTPNRPGMICYDGKHVNVDCGCCFGRGTDALPGHLGAYCLENGAEIYHDLPKRVRKETEKQERERIAMPKRGLDRKQKKKLHMRNKKLLKQYPFLAVTDCRTGKVLKDELAISPDEDGWMLRFFHPLMTEIRDLCEQTGQLHTVRIAEYKEKYGRMTLSVHAGHHGEEFRRIIRKYEEMSSSVCIGCGKPAEDDFKNPFPVPLCRKCKRKGIGEASL